MCLFPWLWTNKGREYYQPDRLQPLHPHPLPERPGVSGVVGGPQGGVGSLTPSQPNIAETGMPHPEGIPVLYIHQRFSILLEITTFLKKGVFHTATNAVKRAEPSAPPFLQRIVVFYKNYTDSSARIPSASACFASSGSMISARNSSTCCSARPVKSSGFRMASTSS